VPEGRGADGNRRSGGWTARLPYTSAKSWLCDVRLRVHANRLVGSTVALRSALTAALSCTLAACATGTIHGGHYEEMGDLDGDLIASYRIVECHGESGGPVLPVPVPNTYGLYHAARTEVLVQDLPQEGGRDPLKPRRMLVITNRWLAADGVHFYAAEDQSRRSPRVSASPDFRQVYIYLVSTASEYILPKSARGEAKRLVYDPTPQNMGSRPLQPPVASCTMAPCDRDCDVITP
jgi:hypothetical protein